MYNQFDIIDKKVIQMISASDDEGALIINQFLHSHIIQREISPVGWFSDYHVDDKCSPILEGREHIGNVVASVNNMELGIGFVLHIKNGIISCLEAFTYGENLPTIIEVVALTNHSDITK